MDKIEELLTRGVEQILPNKQDLEKVLQSGNKLRIYQGFDPTSPQLHIGHLVGLRKLKQWQDLGHEVIFLVGDFTAQIGDPTGKEETRPLLSRDEIEKNAKTYKEQAGKILNFEGNNAVKLKFNSEWLNNLKTVDILNLTSQVTYQQVIKRGMFKKRLEKDEDISMNEIMYPIMQGYDSVAMDIDVEVGGSDQLFNMMMGRDLMHKMKRKNKFVMTTPLLTDSAGNKIGKSEGNAIALTDPAEKIFGAIMNFPDDAIVNGLKFLTNLPISEIEEIESSIKKGGNPLQSKKRLALEIVSQLYDKKTAGDAQSDFESKFQKGNLPENFDIKIKEGISILDAVTTLVESKSQAKRLFDQGAIEINGEPIKDGSTILKSSQILKVGKKIFAKVE